METKSRNSFMQNTNGIFKSKRYHLLSMIKEIVIENENVNVSVKKKEKEIEKDSVRKIVRKIVIKKSLIEEGKITAIEERAEVGAEKDITIVITIKDHPHLLQMKKDRVTRTESTTGSRSPEAKPAKNHQGRSLPL
jgi:hypothetical protein